MTDMKITEADMRRASMNQDAAPDIIMATQIALLARGVTEAYEVVAALLGAAWLQHKELHGHSGHKQFAVLLRGFADTVERAERPH